MVRKRNVCGGGGGGGSNSLAGYTGLSMSRQFHFHRLSNIHFHQGCSKWNALLSSDLCIHLPDEVEEVISE